MIAVEGACVRVLTRRLCGTKALDVALAFVDAAILLLFTVTRHSKSEAKSEMRLMLLFIPLHLMSFRTTRETLIGKVVVVPDASHYRPGQRLPAPKVTPKSIRMPEGKAVLAGKARQFIWSLLHGKSVRVEREAEINMGTGWEECF